MSDPLLPHPDKAWLFLTSLLPDQPLYVETMASDGDAQPKVRQFLPKEREGFESYFEQANSDASRRNIYFLPNSEFLKGRRNKANIAKARVLQVDLDAKDYPGDSQTAQDRIIGLLLNDKERPKGVPKSSAAWFTGGGMQAVWILAEPVDRETAETLNAKLLIAHGVRPGTHNVDRLLRMPGSINWLNHKKRSDGREPALATQYYPLPAGAEVTAHDLTDFKLDYIELGKISQEKDKTSRAELGPPRELPGDLVNIFPGEGKPDPRWLESIKTGNNPSHKEYPSRSELVLGATIWLLGQGVAPEHVLSVLTCPRLGISARVREQSQPLKNARHEVQRALVYRAANEAGWPKTTKNGIPVAGYAANVRHGLKLCGVTARHNRFSLEDEFDGPGLENRDIKDIAEILGSQFERKYGFLAKTERICRELTALAHENSYHPVQEYLDALEWDGTARLDTWLIDYCQGEDSELNREFGAKTLLGAVARIFQPGIKFDTILVLESPQGCGKSSTVAALSPESDWVSEGLSFRMDDKARGEILKRAWIVELPELDGMNGANIQELKGFVSKTADHYRVAYAKHAQSFKRHSIIIGTTNDNAYLRDQSGNRRFLPVLIGKCDVDGFKAARDQIWAEAVHRFRQGEALTLSEHLWEEAAKAQSMRTVDDAFETALAFHFAEKEGRIHGEHVYRLLNILPERRAAHVVRSVKTGMENQGWREGPHRFKSLDKVARGFAKGKGKARQIEWVAKVEGGKPPELVPAGEQQQELDDESDLPF